MEMEQTFGVIGGDRRQAELASLLVNDGYMVTTYGLERWKSVGAGALEQAAAADVVILPLPLCKGEGVLNCEESPMTTRDLFACLRPGQKVLAGQVKQAQRLEAAEYGVALWDYFQREELTVANAAMTAEAALQVAMEHLNRTLLGMPCLVLGFGRIGKLLCHRLQGLGARVTATARQPADLAWIRAYGLRALQTDALSGKLAEFGVVFNTIPSMVIDSNLVAQLPTDCLCVDLASEPGIDLAAAEKQGLCTVWARSLPGRLLPCSAARAILDAVYYMISEERSDPV